VNEPLPAAVRHDPLIGLTGSGDGRWWFTAAIAASNFVTLVVAPMIWSDPGVPLGYADVVGRGVWALVGVPVGLFLYFWVPIAISTLIPELRANRVLEKSRSRRRRSTRRGRAELDDPEPGLDHVAATIDETMDRRVWREIGAVSVAGSFALGLATIWPASPTARAVTALAMVGTAVPIYAGTVMILRLIFGLVAATRSIGQAEPRVIPGHGDEAGGWGGFGRRFFVLARAALLYGLVAIIVNAASIAAGRDPSRSPVSLITLSYFVVLPPIVVWAWFYAPHEAMLRARVAAVAPLSRAFEKAQLEGLEDAVAGQDPVASLRAGSDRLAELERRRELIVKAYPAWPLRLAEIRAVWATAFLPVVTAIVTAVAGIVAGWLTPPGD
jgi:hypothetical protein